MRWESSAVLLMSTQVSLLWYDFTLACRDNLECEAVFVSQMKSVSQCLQKTTDEICSVHITPMFSWHCWETAGIEACEGPGQSMHVQIPLHWVKKKSSFGPKSYKTHTNTQCTQLCSSTLWFSASVTVTSLVLAVPGNETVDWNKHTQLHKLTLACRHNEGFRFAFAKALAQSCPYGLAWIMDKCALGAIK